MGRIRIETIAQLSRHGYVVAVKCRCGNNSQLTAAHLVNMRVSRLVELDDRLKCRVCGARPHDVHVTLPVEK